MPENLAIRASSYSRLLRLTTMMRIRWFAIICQTATLLFVAFYLGFSFPLVPCLLLVAVSVWLNVFLIFYYPLNHRLTPAGATAILGIDILLLSGLLYFTGGLQNPFSILLVAPAGFGAASLDVRFIILLNLLVIAVVCVLAFLYKPLPWYHGVSMQMPPLIIDGIQAAVTASLIFTTAYSYRVAEEARQLADALAATELVLQQEQHLSALDGLAAAAAHELGTPLATIQVVVRELQHQLGSQARFADDMELLISQTRRCRDILQRLASLSTEGGEPVANLLLTALIEEVVAPHRDFGIDIEARRGETVGPPPVFHRNPGILYGLGNLVENAVDFACHKVFIDYHWTEKHIAINVLDDGKGFPPHILDRIGEPYTTSRERARHGGGLGLGLFIAKTLLERSGANVCFRNNPDKALGAEVRITWPHNTKI